MEQINQTSHASVYRKQFIEKLFEPWVLYDEGASYESLISAIEIETGKDGALLTKRVLGLLKNEGKH